MIKRNGFLLAAVLFGLSFMTACSKNLMPPEGLDGAALVGSQMSQSSDSRGGAGAGAGAGGAGSGFNITEQGSGSGSGFLSEESVGESARSGGFITSGPDGSAPDGGSGSGSGSSSGDAFAGSFDSEPFLDSNSGSDGSGGFSAPSSPGFRGRSNDEARRQDFKSTGSLQDIYFKFDRYELDEESRNILKSNASYLKANSSATVEIQGHCDERGTNNYNIALGERRAQSTKMYLVSQGVSARRIHTISYGEERPFCFDSNDACWFKNRRAHFRVSK